MNEQSWGGGGMLMMAKMEKYDVEVIKIPSLLHSTSMCFIEILRSLMSPYQPKTTNML